MGWFFLTQSLSTEGQRSLVSCARDQLSQVQPDHEFVILWMTMPYRLSQSRSWLVGGVLLPTSVQNYSVLQRCETVLRATMHRAHQLTIQSVLAKRRDTKRCFKCAFSGQALGPREANTPFLGERCYCFTTGVIQQLLQWQTCINRILALSTVIWFGSAQKRLGSVSKPSTTIENDRVTAACPFKRPNRFLLINSIRVRTRTVCCSPYKSAKESS